MTSNHHAPYDLGYTRATMVGKNDGIDSFIVADYVRAGLVEIEPWRGSQYLALQRLTRQRRHISEAIAREKNYVLNNIFLKFSEFALLSGEESPVSNKFSATAEAILTEYKTTEDIANAPLEELIDFVSSSGHGRFSDPDQVAGLLQKAARNSYRLRSESTRLNSSHKRLSRMPSSA